MQNENRGRRIASVAFSMDRREKQRDAHITVEPFRFGHLITQRQSTGQRQHRTMHDADSRAEGRAARSEQRNAMSRRRELCWVGGAEAGRRVDGCVESAGLRRRWRRRSRSEAAERLRFPASSSSSSSRLTATNVTSRRCPISPAEQVEGLSSTRLTICSFPSPAPAAAGQRMAESRRGTRAEGQRHRSVEDRSTAPHRSSSSSMLAGGEAAVAAVAAAAGPERGE